MRLCSSSIFLGILVGCASTPVPRDSRPSTAPSAAAVDSTKAADPLPPAVWRENHFRVSVRVRTVQADSAAADSLTRESAVSLSPSPAGTETDLLFKSDTALADSLSAPLEQSVRMRVDDSGHTKLLDESVESCVVRPPEISPLFVRQLVYPSSISDPKPGGVFVDSLNYTSCVQGVRVVSALELQWTASDSGTDQGLAVTVRIRGRVQADSSQRLPMTLTGTVTGHSSLIFRRDTRQLERLESDISSELDALMGTRHQRFTQSVSYRATSSH